MQLCVCVHAHGGGEGERNAARDAGLICVSGRGLLTRVCVWVCLSLVPVVAECAMSAMKGVYVYVWVGGSTKRVHGVWACRTVGVEREGGGGGVGS